MLNRQGIPTPSEYKQRQGLRYNTPFRVKKTPLWSANTVLRILRNPVYTGTLAQGRVTTPTYKVRRTVSKPREEWAVVENCHEAIIDRSQFEVTQRVLDMDTRTCAKGMPVDLFCGEKSPLGFKSTSIMSAPRTRTRKRAFPTRCVATIWRKLPWNS